MLLVGFVFVLEVHFLLLLTLEYITRVMYNKNKYRHFQEVYYI